MGKATSPLRNLSLSIPESMQGGDGESERPLRRSNGPRLLTPALEKMVATLKLFDRVHPVLSKFVLPVWKTVLSPVSQA